MLLFERTLDVKVLNVVEMGEALKFRVVLHRCNTKLRND